MSGTGSVGPTYPSHRGEKDKKEQRLISATEFSWYCVWLKILPRPAQPHNGVFKKNWLVSCFKLMPFEWGKNSISLWKEQQLALERLVSNKIKNTWPIECPKNEQYICGGSLNSVLCFCTGLFIWYFQYSWTCWEKWNSLTHIEVWISLMFSLRQHKHKCNSTQDPNTKVSVIFSFHHTTWGPWRVLHMQAPRVTLAFSRHLQLQHGQCKAHLWFECNHILRFH